MYCVLDFLIQSSQEPEEITMSIAILHIKKLEIKKVHISKTEKSRGRSSFRNGLIQGLEQHHEDLVSFHCPLLSSIVVSEPSTS